MHTLQIINTVFFGFGILHILVSIRGIIADFKTYDWEIYVVINPVIIACQLIPVINVIAFITRTLVFATKVRRGLMFNGYYPVGAATDPHGEPKRQTDSPIHLLLHHWPFYTERAIAWVLSRVFIPKNK